MASSQNYKLKGGNYYEITVKLSTDFQRLNQVQVIRNEFRNETITLEQSTANDKGPVQIIIQFVVLLLLQLLLFNNIQFSGFINPYVYVLFFILLPFDFPGSLMLLLALIMGLILDLFMGTPGVHSAATVLMAFARPGVLNLIAPHDGYDLNTLPRVARWD